MESASKGHNNPFTLCNFILAVVSLALGSFAYFCLPWIMYGVQEVVFLLEWFRVILSYGFFGFSVVIVLVFAVICIQNCMKPEENKQDEDPLEELGSTISTTIRPSRPGYNYNNNYYYRVTEVDDDHYHNNNNSTYYMENLVPAYEPVKMVEERYEKTVTEEKMVRRTRSEKKNKEKVTMMYRKTESERMIKTTSLSSQKKTNALSSEDFRMKVETFIMEKKKMFHWQTGEADHWRNGTPAGCQWQHRGTPYDAIDQCQYGGQNGGTSYQAIDQWQYDVPQCQDGAIDQWSYYEPQWQNEKWWSS